MDVIPVAATFDRCTCGAPVRLLALGGRVIPLDAPVHGLTERFDKTGGVTHYDHLAVYPPHQCR